LPLALAEAPPAPDRLALTAAINIDQRVTLINREAARFWAAAPKFKRSPMSRERPNP